MAENVSTLPWPYLWREGNTQPKVEEIGSFRLIEVKDMCIVHASLSSTNFVALSYMWGTAPKMKLQKIDWEELAIPESLELLRGWS